MSPWPQPQFVHGADVTLSTRGLTVHELLPDWRQRLLSVIANPSFALILLMIGVYGLIFEFSSPGFGLPGTVSAICLLLSLFALQLLPVNYAGLGLILLGMALLAAEVFTPGFGVPLPLIFGLAATSAAVVMLVGGMALRARKRPVVSGSEEMVVARGVVFQLGRFWKVKGPGLVLVIPGIQQMVRVDLRVVTMDVEPQDVISRDNVSVKVNAVVFFRVVDPAKAIIQVENFLMATSQLAQTTLRVVLGKHELDEMLAERERLNLDVQQILDAQTDAWGIKVTNVEIKHIDLNETMVRAIARQAEAERERRAKVIHAEGEKQAAAALLEAARMLAEQPEAMQLRYLQTMTQVAGDRASTVVLPLPMDLLSALASGTRKEAHAQRG